ncbi:MAG TPA: hypothetical protein VMY77_09640, partial [Chitinophagaceae bacterium]|nr:hypothetical protein [Chitinophagaceae bacterium]
MRLFLLLFFSFLSIGIFAQVKNQFNNGDTIFPKNTAPALQDFIARMRSAADQNTTSYSHHNNPAPAIDIPVGLISKSNVLKPLIMGSSKKTFFPAKGNANNTTRLDGGCADTSFRRL